MQRKLRMKCPSCSHWNRVPVNKAFFEPDNQPEPKVKVMIPMYQPLQITKCEKCGTTIAEPKVLIRIIEGKIDYYKKSLGLVVKADGSHPEYIEFDESYPAWVKQEVASREHLSAEVSRFANELSRHSNVLEKLEKLVEKMQKEKP